MLSLLMTTMVSPPPHNTLHPPPPPLPSSSPGPISWSISCVAIVTGAPVTIATQEKDSLVKVIQLVVMDPVAPMKPRPLLIPS